MVFSTFRRKERIILLIVVDLILVNLATLFALWLHATRTFESFDTVFLGKFSAWFLFFSTLWIISASLNGYYEPGKIFVLVNALPALLGTVAFILVVYLGIFFFSAPLNILPRGIVLYQGVSGLGLIGIWRLLYASMAQRPGFGRRAIIVGAGWAGTTIARAITQYARHEYHIIGFVDDNENLVGSSVNLRLGKNAENETISQDYESDLVQIPVLATSKDLRELVIEHQVPEIILAVTHQVSTPMFLSLLNCKEQGVQISLMPVLYEQLTGRVPIEHIGDNWNVALPLDSAEAGGIYPIANRLFDVILSLIGLVILLPLFPIIALAIYLDSPGPIFYKQERLSKGGKPFDLYKLRTMIPDAEKSGAERAKAGDDRITRVGKYLRKIRLDEMPQLINILKGDMSAVGPRPERPEHLEELDKIIPFHRLRNAVKPGMAGWAVVNYGYIESVEDARIRLQYDLYYVKHQSLWLDFVILLRMVWQAVTLKGR